MRWPRASGCPGSKLGASVASCGREGGSASFARRTPTTSRPQRATRWPVLARRTAREPLLPRSVSWIFQDPAQLREPLPKGVEVAPEVDEPGPHDGAVLHWLAGLVEGGARADTDRVVPERLEPHGVERVSVEHHDRRLHVAALVMAE